jgi:SNF2 family DNA or RNA helicase
LAIAVSYSNHKFCLQIPYTPGLNYDLRAIQELPVRFWDKKTKMWEVPELAVQSLEKMPKGITQNWTPEALAKKDFIVRAIERLVEYKFGHAQDSQCQLDFLRDYQKMGVDFLVHAKKGLLSDEMGLGKSVQAIAALEMLGTQSNLVVCPASLKRNWANEFQKHFGIDAVVISGNKTTRDELWKGPEPYKIANYDILSRDWNTMPRKWDAIVVDEAVMIKSHSAIRTRLLKRLKADVRIALSGMPIENHLLDLHSILEWVRPEVVPTYPKFKYRYIDYDGGGKIRGYKNLHELHLLTSPYILRRTKEEVAKDLPPKNYIEVPLEYDAKEKQMYNAICNELWGWLKTQTGNSWHAGALEKLIRLRQFVEFPENVGIDDLSNVKLEYLKDLYTNFPKLVVFTNYLGSVECLQKEFNTDYVISGSVKADTRVDVVDAFNAQDQGMLIVTTAGKFGLNITGASNCVHLGYDFNPATMAQREDRLHRIGQHNSVSIFCPYIEGTVDVGIRERYLKRRADAEAFMQGSEQYQIEHFSKSDIRDIMHGN